MYKRFCNSAREWLPASLTGGSWQTIDMEIPNYEVLLENDLICNDHVILNGLRWSVIIRQSGNKPVILLQASMDEDDGCHWSCPVDMKLVIKSNSKAHPDKENAHICRMLTWDINEMGFIMALTGDEKFRQIYYPNGTLRISVQFLPKSPSGFYTAFQRKMKHMLESGIDSDVDLVPTQGVTDDRILIPCHSHILKSLAGSPVFKEVIKNGQIQNGRIEIELDLRPETVRTLLDFVYFEKDYEIARNPQTASDLLKFGVEYKMKKLVDRCLQIFSSQETQNNAGGFPITIALDLYLTGALHMGRINKSNRNDNRLMTEQRCSQLTRSMAEILKRKNLDEVGNAQALQTFRHDHPALSKLLVETELRVTGFGTNLPQVCDENFVCAFGLFGIYQHDNINCNILLSRNLSCVFY